MKYIDRIGQLWEIKKEVGLYSVVLGVEGKEAVISKGLTSRERALKIPKERANGEVEQYIKK